MLLLKRMTGFKFLDTFRPARVLLLSDIYQATIFSKIMDPIFIISWRHYLRLFISQNRKVRNITTGLNNWLWYRMRWWLQLGMHSGLACYKYDYKTRFKDHTIDFQIQIAVSLKFSLDLRLFYELFLSKNELRKPW